MKTILIVEDDKKIIRMLVRRLAKVGYKIETAENGKIGVIKALELKPDLILLDMHMPVMDGYTAATELRKKNYNGIITAITASAMVEETNKSLEAGCDSFIAKPIGPDFESQIESLFHRKF